MSELTGESQMRAMPSSSLTVLAKGEPSPEDADTEMPCIGAASGDFTLISKAQYPSVCADSCKVEIGAPSHAARPNIGSSQLTDKPEDAPFVYFIIGCNQ
jgi:hypothetical protein